MLICTYRSKTKQKVTMNTQQKLEYTSRTLKVVQVIAVGFALAQLSIVLAIS